MQRPYPLSYGWVKQNVDGCLFVWTGLFFKFLWITVSSSAVRRSTCVYFMSVNVTFAVAVSRRPCTCPTTGNILILHLSHCIVGSPNGSIVLCIGQSLYAMCTKFFIADQWQQSMFYFVSLIQQRNSPHYINIVARNLQQSTAEQCTHHTKTERPVTIQRQKSVTIPWVEVDVPFCDTGCPIRFC